MRVTEKPTLGSTRAGSTSWAARFSLSAETLRHSAVRELLKITEQPGMISFAGGLPAPDLFPLKEAERALVNLLRELGSDALQYGPTEGLSALRDWIARRYATPSLPLTRGNVMIVTGAQQGLDLLGRILINPGDCVAVENPTYLALLTSWRSFGAKFTPLHVGPCAGKNLVPTCGGWARTRFAYVVPNYQNPTGDSWSLEARRELVRWARAHDIGLIEDDPYGDLRFEGTSLPGLLELDAVEVGSSEWNVVRVGTFSKTLAPGLRVGWVIGPESLIGKLVQAKQAADLHTSGLGQHLVHRLLLEHLLDRQIPILRSAYRTRRDAMLDALTEHFAGLASWTHPEGGMFLMVRLGAGTSARQLLEHSIARGVVFVPGEEFHLDASGSHTLRLNFSHPSPDRIREGIRTLRELMRVN